jgi:phage recombination protein Bet
MAATEQDQKLEPKAKPETGAKGAPDERAQVYQVGGVEIRLTARIVREYFLPDATDTEAWAFCGFCRFSGLNPFLRECYLTRPQEGGPATVIVAYTSFMKRAERHPQAKGWTAGIVIAPTEVVDTATGELKPPVPIQGEQVDGVYPPFIAVQGTLKPRGYDLVGGWCKVWRKDREQPIVSVLPFDEYVRRRRDGQVMKMWGEKPGTMIRKTAIGACHRESFPDELAGFYLEEEFAGNAELPRAAIEQPVDEPKELPAAEIHPTIAQLFGELGYNRGTREMFLGRYRDKSVDEQVALLRQEVASRGVPKPEAKEIEVLREPPAAQPEPAGGTTDDPGQLRLV